MTRLTSIPCQWPALMRAETAAAYTDEPSVASFRRKVGSVYPLPITKKGQRQKWAKSELDQVIGEMRESGLPIFDAAQYI